MSNYNKQKGKILERWLAKELTTILGLNHERVPNSGGFNNMKNSWRREKLTDAQNLIMSGDIIVPIEYQHITYECKFYKDFSFVSLYKNNEQLNKWIEQASNNPNKIWLIILRVNNQGEFVIYDNTCRFFIPNGCYTVYKGKYTICAYDGFFAANKETILGLKVAKIPVESQSVPQ